MSTVPVRSSSKYCSFMPVEIFLEKANAEQEYETIDESELRDDDVVVEHIHEDAKTEEKEKEDGTKETKEVSPARDRVQDQQASRFLKRYPPAVDQAPQRVLLTRNTRPFTARCSRITRSLCSGFT